MKKATVSGKRHISEKIKEKMKNLTSEFTGTGPIPKNTGVTDLGQEGTSRGSTLANPFQPNSQGLGVATKIPRPNADWLPHPSESKPTVGNSNGAVQGATTNSPHSANAKGDLEAAKTPRDAVNEVVRLNELAFCWVLRTVSW